MRVEWHPRARADVLEIVDLIEIDNPTAAHGVLDEIERQIGKLADFPRMGRLGRVPGTRELVISGTPYVAGYHVAETVVIILRVLHGARRWPRGL